FKHINLRTRTRKNSFIWIVVAALVIGGCMVMRRHVLPVLLPITFMSYLAYGLIRTWFDQKKSKKNAEDTPETPSDNSNNPLHS
ncbi:MAG: hypothetical protein J5773_05130, partial [Verrucomicrobia bacterium]|nr:hypothetical protein [Verrucomicrobiota bacterium]